MSDTRELYYREKKGVLRLILKPCEIPDRALFDLAVKRRTISSHPKRGAVEESYQKQMTGHRGVKSIEYYLEKLPTESFEIIHDLRLKCINSDKFFQIDTLLLSTTVIIPIEVKNWAGDLHFEKKLNQVIRTFPDQSKGKRVQNPVLQVRDQAVELKMWLDAHDLGNIPIEYLFVNSNNQSVITTDYGNEQILQNVSTSEALTDKIYHINRKHKQANVKRSYLKKVSDALIDAHTPQTLDIQQIYKISPAEIITGVHCPKCFSIPMTYRKGKWCCHQCDYRSKTAFLPTLNDYFILYKPTITNQEFRQFFHLPSTSLANKHLKYANLPFTGSKKGRIYHKPEKIFPSDE